MLSPTLLGAITGASPLAAVMTSLQQPMKSARAKTKRGVDLCYERMENCSTIGPARAVR